MDQLDLFGPKTTDELYSEICLLRKDLEKMRKAIFARCSEVEKNGHFLWDEVEALSHSLLNFSPSP